MKPNRRLFLAGFSIFSTLLLLVCLAPDMARTGEQSRIHGSLNNGQTVLLPGDLSPKAQKQFDQGPVEPSLPLNYMTLEFQPTARQQSDLTQLLAEQQQKSSGNYHRWLSPDQFGERFGLSEADLSQITSWLQSQGFTIDKVAHARNWVAFSGTAGLVKTTFKTEIHHYSVNGELHFANSTAPAIPAALAGIVDNIRGLNDFRPKAPRRNNLTKKPVADYSNGCVGAGCEFLAPGDLETIYDVQPLYNSGINGSGQKIAIMGQTDIYASDSTDYQTAFDLEVVAPTVVLYGPDPCGGNLNNCDPNDQVESALDLEVSNALARNATIYYATSEDVFTSTQNAVDDNLAPVITFSYGICEPDDTQADLTLYENVAQQANGQGITWLASTGDSGAAGCDDPSEKEATQGLAVNAPASVPEVTAVGGTEFNENGNYGQYWSLNNGPNGGSALSYIPEIAWNDSAEDDALSASGGGVSIFYALPYWQTGVSGIIGNSFRNTPDVSLSASADNDPYFVCTSAALGSQYSCANHYFFAVGGTSASAPAIAGMVVLLNQYQLQNGFQTEPGVGNINRTLYVLAQSTPNAFHDITTGSNIVPCEIGTPNCTNGSLGYSAGPGYDPVTGLGSVDANEWITNYQGAQGFITSTSLTASAMQINQGESIAFTATVTSANGTPTGSVAFLENGIQFGAAALDNTGVAMLTTTSLPSGNLSIAARYGADSQFAPSLSPPVSVDVIMPDFSIGSNPTTLTIAPGGSATATITISALNGFTGSVNLSCAGAPLESTCTLNPTSVTPGSPNSTLTVTTTAPSAVFGYRRTKPGSPAPVALLALGLLGLLGLAIAQKRLALSKAWRWSAVATLVVLAAVGMASCGGGGGGNSGTPKGAYDLTVTGSSGGLTHSVQVSLNVQ